MKIWLKFVAGTALGVVLYLFFPQGWATQDSWLAHTVDFVIRALRYALFPLMGFSLLVAIYELKKEQRFGRVAWNTVVWGFASTLVMILIGSLVLTFFPPQRITVLSRTETAPSVPSFLEVLRQALPKNVVEIFGTSSDLFLPIFVFVFLMGLVIQVDKRETYLPIVSLSDAFSRLLYQFNFYMVEIVSLFTPLLVSYALLQVFSVPDLRLYVQAGVLISIIVLSAVLLVFPFLYYVLTDRKNPYKVLFANLGAALVALFTGDVFAAQGTLVLQSRENLGVSRKIGAFAYPYLALFSRGGTAMVSLVGFYVVLRSYSSLDVTLEQFLWAIGASVLVSVLLPTVPGAAAYIGIVVMCQWYGKGLEAAYLNLLPIMLWMSGLAAFADVAVAGLVASYLGYREGVLRNIDLKKFV